MLLEGLDYYHEAFVKYGKVPPTPKEFAFAKKYIECGDRKTAYDYAGYASIDNYDKRNQQSLMRRIATGEAVMYLLKIATKEWAMEQELNAHALASKALKAYENADTVRDQINALKFIAQVMGLHK